MKVNKAANDIPIAYIKQASCNDDFMKEMVRLIQSLLHCGKVLQKVAVIIQKHTDQYKLDPRYARYS